MFEKRSVAEAFPHLREQTAWNIFKLQFVAIASLFKTKAMFKRVIVATVTMFFQQWTGINAVRMISILTLTVFRIYADSRLIRFSTMRRKFSSRSV